MLNILIQNASDDAKTSSLFNSLVSTVYSLPAAIGSSGKEVDISELEDFKPNLIITNADNTDRFLELSSSPFILTINDTDSVNSFSFNNTESSNYIHPFVVFSNAEKKYDNRYKCDVSFVGDMSVFGQSGLTLVNDERIVTKFFLNSPTQFSGYCGYCDPIHYSKLYAMSKVTLVDNTNNYRIMDIIYNDGYPVIRDQEQSDKQFLDHIYDVVLNNNKRELQITKQEIVNNHTNYKRMSEIFLKIGLNKFAEHLNTGVSQ